MKRASSRIELAVRLALIALAAALGATNSPAYLVAPVAFVAIGQVALLWARRVRESTWDTTLVTNGILVVGFVMAGLVLGAAGLLTRVWWNAVIGLGCCLALIVAARRTDRNIEKKDAQAKPHMPRLAPGHLWFVGGFIMLFLGYALAVHGADQDVGPLSISLDANNATSAVVTLRSAENAGAYELEVLESGKRRTLINESLYVRKNAPVFVTVPRSEGTTVVVQLFTIPDHSLVRQLNF